MTQIIVVPATRTIRGIATEVVLTTDDGMPAACALNFDHVALARRNRIGSVIASFSRQSGRKRSAHCSWRVVSSRSPRTVE